MMARVLGKRSRSTLDSEPVLPSKRTRLSSRSTFENDENSDPSYVLIDEEEEEEAEEAEQSEYDDDADDDLLQPLPKRPRRSPVKALPAPVTPHTPRFRDALYKSPSTPRQTVRSAGKLFQRLTPQSPLTPSATPTVYQSARQLFTRGSVPSQLVGREDERSQLEDFMDGHASSKVGGCLYISGPPGTGKSAMVRETSEKFAGRTNMHHGYLNCMSIKSSKGLYVTLLNILGGQDDASQTEASAMATLQKMFVSRKAAPMHLVILDEIDHILTMGLESLYQMFEWSLNKWSRLVLVGIANALDLTDRFMPRLKSKNLKPDLLPFLPYTAPQIRNIITTRLKSLLPEEKREGQVPFIHPAAIELCSRKIASQTGDIRKAYEICRRAIDLVETETRQKHEDQARERQLQATPTKKRPLSENSNLASSPRSSAKSLSQTVIESLQQLTAETAPRATIAHLNKVTAAAFSNGTNQRLKTLNLQQKAALCSLVAFERRSRASAKGPVPATPKKGQQSMAPSIKTLFDAYSRLCKADSVLHPLSSSEFREVVGSLEALGLVNEVDGKTGGLVATMTPSKKGRRAGFPASGEEKRVASAVGEEEMEQAAEGVGAGILRSILSGEVLD